MVKTTLSILFATFLIIGTANAAPIQWADNGHWYDVEWVETGLSWEDARDIADQGGGHLVTLNSLDENLFVWDLLNDNLADGTEYRNYWLGGSDVAEEGTWSWVTGEDFFTVGDPLSAEDWIIDIWHPGEPNNGVGGKNEDLQNYLHFWDTQDGEWDDMHNNAYVGGYVIEYEDTPPPVPTPEPGTMFLLGSGLVVLAGFGRKKFFK